MELLDQEEPKPDRPPTSEPGDTLTTRRAKERPSSDPVFLSPWLSPTWSTDDGAAPSVSNEGSIQSPTPGPNQEAETSTAGASNSPNEASIHVVSPGEHLWSIAEETIRQRLGSDVDSKQIGAYWQTLIEENRDRLADPGNPDFILPGQELKLPA